MRNFALVLLPVLMLAACDLPAPATQPESQHVSQDAQIGSRIRLGSATATGDSSSSTDTTFLRNAQRSGPLCGTCK
jgi:hypothetical protein